MQKQNDSDWLACIDPCVRSLVGINHIPVMTAFPAFFTVLDQRQTLKNICSTEAWLMTTGADQNVRQCHNMWDVG